MGDGIKQKVCKQATVSFSGPNSSSRLYFHQMIDIDNGRFNHRCEFCHRAFAKFRIKSARLDSLAGLNRRALDRKGANFVSYPYFGKFKFIFASDQLCLDRGTPQRIRIRVVGGRHCWLGGGRYWELPVPPSGKPEIDVLRVVTPDVSGNVYAPDMVGHYYLRDLCDATRIRVGISCNLRHGVVVYRCDAHGIGAGNLAGAPHRQTAT
jgi:hypothetical protein